MTTAALTILLADNNLEYLGTRAELLKSEGYRVITAVDPVEARRILEQDTVDLAIMDLRLVDETDEKDISGLSLAREIAPAIPKIILTRYPTYEAVRETLIGGMQETSPAVDFVAKQEGPGVLLAAIQRTLRSDVRVFEKALQKMADQLVADYNNGKYQSRTNYRVSISLALAGGLLVVAGIALVVTGWVPIGLVTALGGIVLETVSYPFFRRVDEANMRMDKYHKDLLELRQLETLLAACDGLDSPEKREEAKLEVIREVRGRWMAA